ncbi:uncharacterized protein LOC141656973 [Silene latifolia]|uniref:uncharacterized protein LOC141656973 n=1 Tax=Silene latifolia TaxID=37657 RepID=UPI003D780642
MASKKQKKTVVDFMGCKNLSLEHKETWKILYDRSILGTKFVDTDSLDELGLKSAVKELFDRIGLTAFCEIQAPTFRRFTLEFLATLEIHKDDDPPRITFHLEGEERELSFAQLREIFGIAETGHEEFRKLSDREVDGFWKAISGQAYPLSNEKSAKNADIPHPGLRYVHRVLTSTFLCKGEQTHLPRADLSYLWAMMTECHSHPDWVEIFLNGCKKHQGAASGNIPLGGMVTLLARYFQIEEPKDRVGGEISINIEFMKACDMIVFIAEDGEYIWTLGTNHHYYLRLPPPEERPLPLGPTPAHFHIHSDMNGLFRVPERVTSRAATRVSPAVEARAAPRVSPPAEEVGPSNSSDFVQWRDWREKMEDMLRETLDNTRLSVEVSRCVNRFYLTRHPDGYVEPSKEFYDELAANEQARLARRAVREARSCGASSSSDS